MATKAAEFWGLTHLRDATLREIGRDGHRHVRPLLEVSRDTFASAARIIWSNIDVCAWENLDLSRRQIYGPFVISFGEPKSSYALYSDADKRKRLERLQFVLAAIDSSLSRLTSVTCFPSSMEVDHGRRAITVWLEGQDRRAAYSIFKDHVSSLDRGYPVGMTSSIRGEIWLITPIVEDIERFLQQSAQPGWKVQVGEDVLIERRGRRTGMLATAESEVQLQLWSSTKRATPDHGVRGLVFDQPFDRPIHRLVVPTDTMLDFSNISRPPGSTAKAKVQIVNHLQVKVSLASGRLQRLRSLLQVFAGSVKCLYLSDRGYEGSRDLSTCVDAPSTCFSLDEVDEFTPSCAQYIGKLRFFEFDLNCGTTPQNTMQIESDSQAKLPAGSRLGKLVVNIYVSVYPTPMTASNGFRPAEAVIPPLPELAHRLKLIGGGGSVIEIHMRPYTKRNGHGPELDSGRYGKWAGGYVDTVGRHLRKLLLEE